MNPLPTIHVKESIRKAAMLLSCHITSARELHNGPFLSQGECFLNRNGSPDCCRGLQLRTPDYLLKIQNQSLYRCSGASTYSLRDNIDTPRNLMIKGFNHTCRYSSWFHGTRDKIRIDDRASGSKANTETEAGCLNSGKAIGRNRGVESQSAQELRTRSCSGQVCEVQSVWTSILTIENNNKLMK